MHETHDGPLKRLLENHIKSSRPDLVHVPGITIPDDIKKGLGIGELEEDFKVTYVRAKYSDCERILLGIADKLYGIVGLKRVSHEPEIIPYTVGGKMESGLGVLMSYTIDCEIGCVHVTCKDFEF